MCSISTWNDSKKGSEPYPIGHGNVFNKTLFLTGYMDSLHSQDFDRKNTVELCEMGVSVTVEPASVD